MWVTNWSKVLALPIQAEGIFRINGENEREECIREHLNIGVIPDDIDVHCLAGVIKVVICNSES